MPMMRWSCARGCCVRDSRGAEKREHESWPDEYGDLNDGIRECCPTDGLACICNNFDCDYPEGPWWRTPMRL